MRRVFGIAVLLVALLPRIAAAAGGEGGLINLDKSLIIQAINFLLLLFILSKILYRPLLAKMEERSQAIKKSLDEAQAARAEAQAQRAEHAARVQAAHAEAQAIRATALHEAAEEQRRLVEGARAETEQDIRRARQELRQEVGDLAVAVAERLIKRTLRDEDHRKIIEEALAKMERVG